MTLGLIFGLVGGSCIAGLMFLAWYLNMRFRNLRNAVLEYGQTMRGQERRYDALARQHQQLSQVVAGQGQQLNELRIERNPNERPNPPPNIATGYMTSQVEMVDETVTAWEHILREDDNDPALPGDPARRDQGGE